jgi:hypothetical protein
MEATCSAQGNGPRVSKRGSVTCVQITTYKLVVSEMSVSRLRVYLSFAEEGRGASNKYVGCNGDHTDMIDKM